MTAKPTYLTKLPKKQVTLLDLLRIMNEMIPVSDIMLSDSLPPADESLASPHENYSLALMLMMMLLPSSRRQLRSGPQRFSNSCHNRPRLLQCGGLLQCVEQTTPDWLRTPRTVLNGQFRCQGLGFRAFGGGGKTPYVAQRHWPLWNTRKFGYNTCNWFLNN